jgi:DNA-directed RNA polymerase
MDSSHLQKTVVLAALNDVTHFAMIHDSYGTHACDTDVLGQALRETFVEQYQGDVLAEFRAGEWPA